MREGKRILFIAGSWRSGSTLLGDLLGSAPGFCHVGELHHFWGRGLQRNWLCGCGECFHSCPFWRQVVHKWGTEIDLQEAAKLDETRRALSGERARDATPALMREAHPHYVDAVRRLAEAVFQVSEAAVVVDSSKSFRQGCALLSGGEVELMVVHLVRDPRASAFSLLNRPKRRLDDPQGSSMLNFDLDRAVAHWMGSNFEAMRLGQLAHKYFLQRYEDLAREPLDSLNRILEFTDGPACDAVEMLGLLGASRLPPSHTISGNPDRLRASSRTRICLDDEWLTRMERSMKDQIGERTRDWMQRFGYA